jgi:D-alanine-D-alanine ligase
LRNPRVIPTRAIRRNAATEAHHELEERMKIALLFDGASALGKSADLAILQTLEAIEAVLVADDHEVTRFPAQPDGRWVERMRRGKFDLVFNMCEGLDGVAALEPAVISALEVLAVPFTGCSSWTASLCLRKHVVNAFLERAGLPVPPFAVVHPGAPIPTVGFPAICKPAAEDASVGVEQRSVVRTNRALAARVEAMHEGWDEVLVQRYVDGREVNVGIVGNYVLPVAEIRFDGLPKRMWRIVSYRSKWVTGSDEDVGAVPACPADLPEAMSAKVKEIALAAWRLVGGTGYGRVDMRIDANGQPWILEVNANPDIAHDAGLARMAAAAGLDYGALIRSVCDDAVSRYQPSIDDRWALAQRLSGVIPEVSDAAALQLVAGGER